MPEYLAALLPLLLTQTQLFAAAFTLSMRFDRRSSFALRVTLTATGAAGFTALSALACFYMPAASDLWAEGICIPQTVIAVFFRMVLL